MPASRITDIVGASTLTDDEIQQLIEVLLQKSNANSEWEAVSEVIDTIVVVVISGSLSGHPM